MDLKNMKAGRLILLTILALFIISAITGGVFRVIYGKSIIDAITKENT